jgi:uncharacterized membrane protein
MRLGPPSRLLLILALLLAIAGPSGVAAGAPATAPEPEHPRLQSGTVEPNETVLELVVDADGDARWTVTHSFDLADENDTRAFDRLAGEFERGEVGGRYLATMERAREAASETTGREMAIRNVSREATVVNGTGRLTTTFTWTSFARASGDTLRIGDAFRLPSGSWLPGLASDERLVVAPPDGYRIDSAPSADSFRNGSLVWEGPTEFESDYLSITYREVTAPPSPQSGTNGTETPLPGFFEEWLLPVVGGAFAIGLLALVAYLFVREEGPSGPAVEMNGGVDDDDGTEPSAAEPDGTAGPAEPAEPESGADPDSGSKPPDEDEGDVDPELLSDEERVERLLERNGGRMKQANIVKETNWSNAKVSQLLSSMDEEGRIDKLRIGRENLITLPGEEPGEFTE